MDETVKPTYNKRRKGYTFKMDGMEVFVKSEDENAAIKQMQELLEKEEKNEESEKHSFADGGLLDEGGTVDPVSGNDVPPGSTQEEVRDDIPAQLSEGEFVFPADVVRYIGLENLMELRQKAKQGLRQMEAMGQMGNSDEATMSDNEPFEGDIDALIDEFDPDNPDTFEFNLGGVVPGQLTSSQTTPMYQPPATLPSFTSFVQQPAQQAAQAVQPVVEQKEYIGPNGERITIQFVNGNPATPIPEGYKPFDPTAEPATPEIAKPEVVPQSDEDPEATAPEDPTMTALSQMKELGIVDDKIIDSYRSTAKKIGIGAFFAGPAGILSSPAIGERIKSGTHEDIAKTMGITKNQFEDAFVEKNVLGLTEKYKNLEEMKALQDSYKERKPAFDSKSDEEKQALQETAKKYGTAAWSEQTEMLKEQDEGLFDDNDNEDTVPDSTEQNGGGYEGFGDEPGEDEFNKGGVAKQRKKKGLGRLKT